MCCNLARAGEKRESRYAAHLHNPTYAGTDETEAGTRLSPRAPGRRGDELERRLEKRAGSEVAELRLIGRRRLKTYGGAPAR